MPLPASAAHVVIDDLAEPRLSDSDAHHLWRVLRLRTGEVVTLTDGRGGWRRGAVVAAADLRADGPIHREAHQQPPVAVGFALSKGDKPEWTVQKLTELGVDRIVLFPSARSVVRWDEAKIGRQRQRLDAVVRGAVGQSRRLWVPQVEVLAGYPEAVAALGPCSVADMAAREAPSLARPAVLVGPEGGWTEEERAAAPATVRLSNATLRAETAALAAGCILTALREDILGYDA